MYTEEPHIRERVRDPTYMRDSKTERGNEVYINKWGSMTFCIGVSEGRKAITGP